VSLITRGRRFDPPPGYDVKIDSAGIGGPSAGLAFTLGTIDALTKGELTGGRDVAVTGTIEISGQVGPVGGVVQKTAAVRRQGAEVFLVPPEEYKEAKAHAGKHLKVVKVATIGEAIAALGQLGGDTSALGSAASRAQG
jgi:PDZ domain-containing protein